MDIDGKKIAKRFREEMRLEIETHGYSPTLAFMLVGEDPASQTYVRMKGKACAEVGIQSKKLQFPEEISESELLNEIEKLNKDPNVQGILVQMPLPKQIDERKVITFVDPEKDVDGFHPINIGKMMIGEPDCFIACTPLGILKLLEASNIETTGKDVVVLGRSNIVGRPIANLLSQKNEKSGDATVTVAHSRTKNLNALCKQADIIIAAIGRAKFVTKEMVKKGAVVIDVGINRTNEGLVGDVDYDNVAPLCSWITPVPGGVGPMTIAILLFNTLQSYKRKVK